LAFPHVCSISFLLIEGIPTLSDLAKLALPPPPFPHPGHGATKEYAKLRRRAHYEHIRAEVSKLAEPRIAAILSRSTWQEKQDAVDDLFEKIEFQLRDSEPILSGHPQFGAWVEQALESYLKTIKGKEGEKSEPVNNATEESSTEDAVDISPISADDDEAVPVFMDCYSAEDPADQVVPNILHPLRPHPNDGPGRMVEEWELAANDKSKRIMLRQSTRKIARALLESPSVRVLVKGKRGVGKVSKDALWLLISEVSAVLLSFVIFRLTHLILYLSSVGSHCINCGVSKKVWSDCLVSSGWKQAPPTWLLHSTKSQN